MEDYLKIKNKLKLQMRIVLLILALFINCNVSCQIYGKTISYAYRNSTMKNWSPLKKYYVNVYIDKKHIIIDDNENTSYRIMDYNYMVSDTCFIEKYECFTNSYNNIVLIDIHYYDDRPCYLFVFYVQKNIFAEAYQFIVIEDK